MKKPEFTKAFDVEHAKAGAPYCCAGGAPAEILHYGAGKLIGMTKASNGEAFAAEWKLFGKYEIPGHQGALDLVMLPLGLIDGKPVFVGDKIVAPSGNAYLLGPTDTNLTGCRWPAPAKVYPETKMTEDELVIAANDGRFSGLTPPPFHVVADRIANAAIRHAIDAGQVMLIADAERLIQANEDIDRRSRERRDMAIARAVADKVQYTQYVSSKNGSAPDEELQRIIAGVK